MKVRVLFIFSFHEVSVLTVIKYVQKMNIAFIQSSVLKIIVKIKNLYLKKRRQNINLKKRDC